MESDARSILAEAVSSPIERSLVDIMLAMRKTLDGERMELPERADQVRDPLSAYDLTCRSWYYLVCRCPAVVMMPCLRRG